MPKEGLIKLKRFWNSTIFKSLSCKLNGLLMKKNIKTGKKMVLKMVFALIKWFKE